MTYLRSIIKAMFSRLALLSKRLPMLWMLEIQAICSEFKICTAMILREIRQDIAAYSYSDSKTLEAIAEVYEKYNYLICPHTAVAYLGVKAYHKQHGERSAWHLFWDGSPC